MDEMRHKSKMDTSTKSGPIRNVAFDHLNTEISAFGLVTLLPVDGCQTMSSGGTDRDQADSRLSRPRVCGENS